jgi:hypothetical protein
MRGRKENRLFFRPQKPGLCCQRVDRCVSSRARTVTHFEISAKYLMIKKLSQCSENNLLVFSSVRENVFSVWHGSFCICLVFPVGLFTSPDIVSSRLDPSPSWVRKARYPRPISHSNLHLSLPPACPLACMQPRPLNWVHCCFCCKTTFQTHRKSVRIFNPGI